MLFFMEEMLSKRKNDSIFILLVSTLIFITTYQYVGGPIRTGIGSSFQFAFNYFFDKKIQIGEDALFTFGPLGFLLWPQPIGKNILIATLVNGVLSYLFIYLSLLLNSITKDNITIFEFSIVIILTFLISTQIDLHNCLILICTIFILLHKLSSNVIFLLFASIIAAFSLEVKISAGIISALILISYCLIKLLKDKDIFTFSISFITLSLTFILIWFFLYGNLNGIGDYFKATIEFSKGNSSAMTINPENNWYVFSLFLFSFLVTPYIIKDNNIVFLFFILLVPTAVYFKYSFSRADSNHIIHFLLFLSQYHFILILSLKDIKYKYIAIMLLTFLCFSIFIPDKPNDSALIKFFTQFKNNFNNKPFISYKADFTKKLIKSNENIESRKLDIDTLDIIKSSSIDIYPWDTLYIYANGLNWANRPIFQSYITYTPYLDKKNASFYKSMKSPEFVLWQKNHWGGELGSIDGRYLLNDEPLTIIEIINKYRIVHENSDLLLLKKSKFNYLGKPKIVYKSVYQWNTWIEVPKNISNKNNIIRAKVNIERTLFQKIKKLLYKEFEVFLTYKFKNGIEEKYRIVVDNAKNGLWINPFQRKLLVYDWNNEVIEIKITHSNGDYFKENIDIYWEVTNIKVL